ncbi:MAG: 3-deoxy-D-manno-octulosonic acid transferase [Paludibacteraceae bacterium]|nr:3-deoxy-D-manno-octulosonic acid transferase [Paludibacteraceae bacterium]MBR5824756.1 3-deoxy-D-manno-octulosonic acid transferase [Paludibacteraceae bacterium]
MRYLYNIAIWFYCLAVRVVAVFNPKVRLMWQGEQVAFDKIRGNVVDGDRVVWVHAASLGEFEQGRPLIEKLKRENPEYKIVLTFFSPSGYEVRKNYAGADVICYLLLDTVGNARRFVELVKPEKVVFVKYEFWLNYLRVLRCRGVETYIISAIFRPNQVFFKWYGGLFREGLKAFKTLFVQNEESKELLKGIGVENVVVAGDTRFDRVVDVVVAAKRLEIVESFVGMRNEECGMRNGVLVVGSSWGPDEELLAEYINSRAGRVKMIIAPHEVREERIKELTERLTCKYALYTQITDNGLQSADNFQLSTLNSYDVLVINTIGLLSSIYQYGQVAYIGGGFGVGIHNTLEAAAWGMPVVFGPNYKKFKEACELIECGAARSIETKEECFVALDEFFERNAEPANAATEYVSSHVGATNLIYKNIVNN